MRIISSFRDYYDGLTDGSDPRIWRRETTEIVLDPNDPFFKTGCPVLRHDWSTGFWQNRREFGEAECGLFGFCGKILPFWRHGAKIGWDLAGYRDEYRRTTGADLEDSKWKIWRYDSVRALFARESIPPRYGEIFLRYRVPLWTMTPGTSANGWWNPVAPGLALNPKLADLQFQRQLDPYQTFQELEMFLFNDLAVQADPPETVSDRVKAEAHGFRDPYSFRREPGEKKRRKKR